MRAVASVVGLIALASCGLAPAPQVYAPPTYEEYLADINSAQFQSWVIYDCVFEPDAAARAAGHDGRRQLIYDENGSPEISYSEPGGGHAMLEFERSVQGSTEVFEAEGYKTIRIDEGGSARLTLNDIEHDPTTYRRVSETPREFTGTCRRGPAWPSGSQPPWCPADPTLAQEDCIIRPEQSAEPISGPAAEGLEAIRLPECPEYPAAATERCIRLPRSLRTAAE